MYSIRLQGDTAALLRKMRRYSELDRKGLNIALAEGVRESTLERFKQGRGPDGKRWKTSIRAAETGGKTLIDSSQLRNSIKTTADASGFAVGTNVKHAATHQFGDKGRTIRAKRAKNLRFQVGGQWISKKKVKVNIPARPFLGLSDEDMQEIKATTEEFIGRDDYANEGERTRIDELKKVVPIKRSHKAAQGDKSLTVDIDLMIVGGIVEDGVEPTK